MYLFVHRQELARDMMRESREMSRGEPRRDMYPFDRGDRGRGRRLDRMGEKQRVIHIDQVRLQNLSSQTRRLLFFEFKFSNSNF